MEWLEERACFSGDNVLGWGTTWVQDLHAYMASLRAMAALRPRRLFPGHGPMVENGPAVIVRYLRHREDRKFHLPCRSLTGVCRGGAFGGIQSGAVKIDL